MNANWDRAMRNNNSRTKKVFRESKNFVGQKITENQNWRFLTNGYFWFFLIFCPTKFFKPRDPFFGSGVAVSLRSIPIGLQDTLYDPFECWKTIVKTLKIQTSTLDKFGLMSAFLAFMALGVKFLQSSETLCQNGPHKVNKL